MLAMEAGTDRLDATIQEVEQPGIGLDFTVTAHIDYVLTDVASGEVAYRETIVSPFTAEFGSAILGVERLKLANEGAVRVDIIQLINGLTATFDQPSLAR